MDGTDGTPIVASGIAVDGSPGWGIDNHSSNVDVTDSVVYGAVGAAFVTEAGDERGSFRDDLALDMHRLAERRPGRTSGPAVAIQDWGFIGHGFWLQSPDRRADRRRRGRVPRASASSTTRLRRGPRPLDLARCHDRRVTGTTPSTPAGIGLYVLPEQARRAEHDRRADRLGPASTTHSGCLLAQDVELVGCRFIGVRAGAAVFLDNGVAGLLPRLLRRGLSTSGWRPGTGAATRSRAATWTTPPTF